MLEMKNLLSMSDSLRIKFIHPKIYELTKSSICSMDCNNRARKLIIINDNVEQLCPIHYKTIKQQTKTLMENIDFYRGV